MSDWLEVLFKMKDVLNFALTMPGAPSVMTVLMSMMLMLFAVSLAILIMVIFETFVVVQLDIVVSFLSEAPRLQVGCVSEDIYVYIYINILRTYIPYNIYVF